MYEHFQTDKQAEYQIEENEFEEMAEIINELVGLDDYDEGTPVKKEDHELLLRGVALMSFRAGRSFQDEQNNGGQFVTVRLPADSAGKWIEKLLSEVN